MKKKLKQELINNVKYIENIKLEDLNNEINSNIFIEIILKFIR